MLFLDSSPSKTVLLLKIRRRFIILYLCIYYKESFAPPPPNFIYSLGGAWGWAWLFPAEKCPKWHFWPFCPPFWPSRAIKMIVLAFFRDILVSFIECYHIYFILFHFVEILLGFRSFFTIFSVFSLFWGYFRRFARWNLQGPHLWLSGELCLRRDMTILLYFWPYGASLYNGVFQHLNNCDEVSLKVSVE